MMMNEGKDVQATGQREEIYYRTDFASADAKYRALVEHDSKDFELQGWISHYSETETLSGIEAEIFGIDPALAPALSWAYERYENLIGSMDAYFGEFREQERIDYAEFFRGEQKTTMYDAIDFMVAACQLPARQCFGWVMKIYSSRLRGGMLIFWDD